MTAMQWQWNAQQQCNSTTATVAMDGGMARMAMDGATAAAIEGMMVRQ
jgi:hypothetical protein